MIEVLSEGFILSDLHGFVFAAWKFEALRSKKSKVEDMFFRTNLTYTGIVKKFDIIIIDSDFQLCDIPL